MPTQRDSDRETMRRMAKVWKRNRPGEADAFKKAVKQVRHGLFNDKAMSQDRTMMLAAMVPPKLDGFMVSLFGRNWKHDPDIESEFWELFSDFKIRKDSKHKRRTDVPTRKDGAIQEARWTTQKQLDLYRAWKEAVRTSPVSG